MAIPRIPLTKRMVIALKFEWNSNVNKTGEKTMNARIFFIIFICEASKYLVWIFHKWQAYVQELAAAKAEIIPNKI